MKENKRILTLLVSVLALSAVLLIGSLSAKQAGASDEGDIVPSLTISHYPRRVLHAWRGTRTDESTDCEALVLSVKDVSMSLKMR